MSRTVDFHAHPVTDEFRKAMKFLGIDPIEDDGFPLPKWSIEEHLDFMSQAEIDFTVLSPPTPHIHNDDDAKSRVAARSINEELSQICRANSDKFAFTAVLPLPDVDGAIDEAAYAIDCLGAVGVKLSSNSNGIYLGDDRFEPLMKELNRRKALAIIQSLSSKTSP